jgi:hypothetical protein
MAITTRDAFVDEEPLGEAPPKTVTRDVAEVVVPSSVGSCLGGAPDDRPAATGGEVDVRFVVLEVVVGEPHLEPAIDSLFTHTICSDKAVQVPDKKVNGERGEIGRCGRWGS